MQIAITSQEKELSSNVDPRFGRARYIILIDSESGQHEVHDNELNLNAAQGAGIQTAQNIANLGAEAVVSGNMGPNAFKTLSAANIKVYLGQDITIQEAVELFKQGKLEQLEGANVEGHWV